MKKLIVVFLLVLCCLNTSFARSNKKVDFDLSKMNEIMAYSMLFEVFIYPEKYLGKTLRVKGVFYRGYSDYIQKHFNYVMVVDSTNCCQTGIEFELIDVENLEENYPAMDTPIIVEGKLSSYEFDGNNMYYLAVEKVEKP